MTSTDTIEILETTAKRLLGEQEDTGVVPVQFTPHAEYTTYRAEWAVDGADLVFHFFPTEENNSRVYWTEHFPAVLERVAQEVFDATWPRLKAAYTPELVSYWLRAYGFASLGDPEARVRALFSALDSALDTTKAST